MNLYESDMMHDCLGDALRPGGLKLTKIALEYCNFSENDYLLDLGCGRGATINYIKNNYDCNICGLDTSEKLVSFARELNKNTEIFVCPAEKTCFEENTFTGILAECTLSLMDDIEKVLEEAGRILKDNGYFIISDIYARNTDFLNEFKNLSLNSCLRNPFDLNELKKILNKKGFIIEFEQHYNNLIIQALADIIFNGGTTDKLCIDENFKKLLVKSKLRYFLAIARKEKRMP